MILAILAENHHQTSLDCGRARARAGKVRKQSRDLHPYKRLRNTTSPSHAPCACTGHVDADRIHRFSQNHRHLECDCGQTRAKPGKVRKLVVIYTHLNVCETPQPHRMQHVHALATWLRLESTYFSQNYRHLECDCGQTKAKM